MCKITISTHVSLYPIRCGLFGLGTVAILVGHKIHLEAQYILTMTLESENLHIMGRQTY